MRSRFIFLFVLILMLFACSHVEPTTRSTSTSSKSTTHFDVHPIVSPEKAAYPEIKPDEVLPPSPNIKADPYAKRENKTLPVYSLKKSKITSVFEAYRDLNMSDNTPMFKRTPPKGRDVVLDAVERTGGNRMNARDPTTNRRVYRQR